MDSASYIQWNIPNWITIFLMALLGYVAFGFIASASKTYLGTSR